MDAREDDGDGVEGQHSKRTGRWREANGARIRLEQGL